MKTLSHTLLLFIIIVIEGYVVLSSELLAIRQTIPYVGSGTDTVSIIIAAVLMPLAFGYQYGGQFKAGKHFGQYITIRKKLILNILIAATILIIGLSHEPLAEFFKWLPRIGIEDRILQTSIYCILFLVIPVYLLGQTVPLLTNFFSKERLSKVTGRILFFSTVGSFLGAILSTLFLMPTIGVHHTVSLNFLLLALLVILLEKNKMSWSVKYICVISLMAMMLNSDAVMDKFKIIKNNEHHMIVSGTLSNGERLLFLNNNNSSRYTEDGAKHGYIEFAERLAIYPILYTLPPREILVIGAGGFTFGHEDKNNSYTYIDIDKDLLEVAEKHILKQPIGDNKQFIPKPARAFLNETDKKFDVIFLDAYLGGVSVPEHLITQEFFIQVRDHLKDNAILISNFILSPHFNNQFTRNIDNTLRSVFPHVSRHVMDERYHLWSESKTLPMNVLYVYKHKENYNKGHIYTDNKNTVFIDKPKTLKP